VQSVQNLIAKVRKAFGPKAETRRIEFNASGFAVVDNGKQLEFVAWSSIREIIAYKEDRFSVDDICLGFGTDDPNAFSRVTEDYIGYKEFLTELEGRFAGIRKDWFKEVAFPAFAVNRTTIWQDSNRKTQA
jgi:hypothetical protein